MLRFVAATVPFLATTLVMAQPAPPAKVRSSTQPPLHDVLLAKMAAYSIPTNEREDHAKWYDAAVGHKGLAVAIRARHKHGTAGWPTVNAAEIGALEACQLTYEEPCALIAVDDRIEAETGRPPALRDMPRTRYAGAFDPQQIPRARPDLLRRADVKSYRSATGPKAAAFHIQGYLFVVTGAANQFEAEKQALAQCNNDPVRNGADGMCILYAVGNRVVLPHRFQTAHSVTGSQIPLVAQSNIIEHLNFDTHAAPGVKLANISATLYLPPSAKPVPAMVIISSSGGVIDWIERYYARELARAGIAGLVVDSFAPRGVRNVDRDQRLVTSWDMENDAFAALAVLQKDPRIDPTRIGVMGVSKGGLVAHQSAILTRRTWRGTGTLAFAAHVAIVPYCVEQHRNVATTGKSIFFMLAELDEPDPPKPCIEYAERIKAAGNPNITVKVYNGAHHNWEDTRPLSYFAEAQNNAKCVSVIEDNGDRTVAAGGQRIKGAEFSSWVLQNCTSWGFHVGGGTDQLKREATSDLVAFLKRNGF